MKRKLGQRSWFFMLPMFLLLAGSVAAAQFSATMMIKDGDRVVSGRIYVQDGKMRQEFTDAEGQTVTIVRPDQKVIWFIMPLERAYAEMPLKGKLPGQFIQIPNDALSKRLAGKETVNGYEAEKYEITVRGRGGPEKQTIWLATKLGTPVKLIAKERNFSVEYKSIREGAQAERLFNLPPGYKKLVSPDLLPSWKVY
jgi:outer membrane lipoprotein-sorting protein